MKNRGLAQLLFGDLRARWTGHKAWGADRIWVRCAAPPPARCWMRPSAEAARTRRIRACVDAFGAIEPSMQISFGGSTDQEAFRTLELFASRVMSRSQL